MLQLGIGKTDITAFKEGVGMLGYGMYYNIMEEVETPLYARAMIFQNELTKVCFVNCEIAFITPSLKRGVVKKLNRKYKELGYSNQNIVLNAQHTHSGPGGYSHHGLYNMNCPGFVIDIYNKIVDGIVEAILKAEENFEEIQMFLGKSEFAPDKEVGFQRSLKAYLQNPEAKQVSNGERHLAINREMTLLKFISKDEKVKAAINWFGTHPTNLPNTNTKVCSDNKGYAAQYLEDSMQKEHEGFVGIFAQGSCGDVTPRFKFNKKHGKQRGQWDGKYLNDDIKSAQYNGELQFEKAAEIINSLSSKAIESSDIDFGLQYTDFGNVQVDEKFTNGIQNVRTSPSCMGVAFLKGTYYDGPGMLEPLGFFSKQLTRVVKAIEYIRAPFMPKEWRLRMIQKYIAQGNKAIVIESGDRRIMGTFNISKLILPSWADEMVSNLKTFHKRGALDNHPWTPQILPLQIVKLGTIALCTFPFEITTIAAQRLKKSLELVLLRKGYSEIILCPYSNAYNGYITTYEEYQVQEYEGGHTVFGEWTLAALQTEFEKLALEMLKPKERRSLSNDLNPLVFSHDDLHKFNYFKGQYYISKLKLKERLTKIKERRRKNLEKRKGIIQKKLDELN
jgi:neutral ceramidase